MVRTRSSATKAAAAKAPRKLTATAKSGHVSKRGHSTRLPPITSQSTPAWQKTIDKFLPKNEKMNDETGVATSDNSGVESFKDPGGLSDVQETGVGEIVTGTDNTPDKEMTESHTGSEADTTELQTVSDNSQPNEISEVETNGVDGKMCKETINLESDKDTKEVTS